MSQQNTEIVKIRASTFIPTAWISSSGDGKQLVEFRGDDREFTPHAVNTGRSRIEQEAVVDFSRRTLTEYADTGTSVERITHADGKEDVRTEKASTDGIFCTDPSWYDDRVEFEMHASASNPLVPHPSPVDYCLELTVRYGTVQVRGQHDGYPCYEFYVQTDFGSFETLYRHDFRETGDEALALSGAMEYEFDARI
ncbi:DUF3238 domain-containing protein [Haladaptatus caseinilyticus]|uniref:DUF3238 domain-containing protein n=1 Tax=Haladaptatus caseinilyticus TaxID=2993314 RepID=UPI00224AB730|nr:DUF3238 domain-containing protein [Haladaptatus caseinilyticus]